jgi:hypothetical protein
MEIGFEEPTSAGGYFIVRRVTTPRSHNPYPVITDTESAEQISS